MEDFDASCSSIDSLNGALYLSLSWSAWGWWFEFSLIQPLEWCFLLEEYYGGFLRGEATFILFLANYVVE